MKLFRAAVNADKFTDNILIKKNLHFMGWKKAPNAI